MSVQIKLRRDTAGNWTLVNPILGAGEPGLETDTLKIKYGDGVTAWTNLAYPTVLATPTAAADLTGTALPANIVSSSLTSVGTLAHLTVTNPIVGNITGNAATATLAANATNAVNSTNAVNADVALTLSGGANNEIVYMTGSGNIAYISAPATPSTYLEWNGTNFSWSTIANQSSLTLASTTGTPTNTGTVASWLKVTVGSNVYYMPLYQ